MTYSRVGNIVNLSAYLKENCGFFTLNIFLVLGQIFRDSLYLPNYGMLFMDVSQVVVYYDLIHMLQYRVNLFVEHGRDSNKARGCN